MLAAINEEDRARLRDLLARLDMACTEVARAEVTAACNEAAEATGD